MPTAVSVHCQRPGCPWRRVRVVARRDRDEGMPFLPAHGPRTSSAHSALRQSRVPRLGVIFGPKGYNTDPQEFPAHANATLVR